MRSLCSSATFLALVSLICAGPGVNQLQAFEASPASSSSTPVAYVYLQTDQGLNVYDAASSGALTLVKGSPFKTTGTWIEADNGKYIFSFDANNLIHTYAVEADGAIGSQVAETNTADYDGANCSKSSDGFGIIRGILDHTGKSLYVQLLGYANVEGGEEAVCIAYQFYQVGSNGKLTSNGAYVLDGPCCSYEQNLTFTGSDKFVYGINGTAGAIPAIEFFKRESNGALEEFRGSAEIPPPPTKSAQYTWELSVVDADPNGHAVIAGVFEPESESVPSSGWKIASYTVGSSGDLTTSNTYPELLTPAVYPEVFNFSPSGTYLAVAGGGIGISGGGLQVLHWNGSKPATAFSGALTDANTVSKIHWDKNDHLYAVGNDQKLYVYTVTSSKITEAPGSPYSFSGSPEGEGLIVVPK